mgnify:CR=1 FL=1
MTDFVWSTAVSITAIGGLIGALIGPILADMFGRYKLSTNTLISAEVL